MTDRVRTSDPAAQALVDAGVDALSAAILDQIADCISLAISGASMDAIEAKARRVARHIAESCADLAAINIVNNRGGDHD